MNFRDAINELKIGKKIARKSWSEDLYFSIENGTVMTHQPRIYPYLYDDSIMISTDWLIDGMKGEYSFCEIIPFLITGSKARLKESTENYIYYDQTDKMLIIRMMEVFPHRPEFDDFLANDWVVIE